MIMEEGNGPEQHGEGGRREELKGARAEHEETVPDVLLYQAYGWGSWRWCYDEKAQAPTTRAR